MSTTMKLIHSVFSDVEPALEAVIALEAKGFSMEDVGLTLPLPTPDKRGRLLQRYAKRIVTERARDRSVSLTDWLNEGVVIERHDGPLATVGLTIGSGPDAPFGEKHRNDGNEWCILTVRAFPALEADVDAVVSEHGGAIEEIRLVEEKNTPKSPSAGVLTRRQERLDTTSEKRTHVQHTTNRVKDSATPHSGATHQVHLGS